MKETMMQSQIHEPMGTNLGVPESSPFDSLAVDFISNIISFTTPRDACVVASISKTFESASKSDIVWDKFLPPEYESLVRGSRHFSSKKELYLSLADDPLLIDDGKKSFWLEKASGKRCIMLSAMDMSIIWGDIPQYWQWIQIPESRFVKVAVLRNVCWFEIRGRTNTSTLSPRTRYSAYTVFKKMKQCYGFEDLAVEARVGMVGGEVSKRFVCLDVETEVQDLVEPEEREDGWMEIELSEFFNEGRLINSNEIEMSALATDQHSWKRGLIIQGIEIRPTKIQ